jgi:uncharacterized SAM-binding protein YcdF (DUF218 family)
MTWKNDLTMQPLGETERIPGLGAPTAPITRPAPPETARRPQSRRRTIAKWVASFLTLALLAPPLLGLSLVGAIYWQARSDQTRSVDAIVVLGTAQFDGRPSPVLRARLDRSLAAYRDGYAPLIIVTGGRLPGDRFTEAEASRDYLVDHDVPERAILLENEGHSSWESMQGVAALLQERGLSRILLVSDGFHLFRLKLMARDLGLTAYGAPATASPIRRNSGLEFSYVLREAVGVVVHLWETR